MTSLQVDDSVDLRNVDNCIPEENNVHLLYLRLLVILVKFLIEVVSKLIVVDDFFVDLCFLVINKEIDKDCIACILFVVLLIGHAVFPVIHLEVCSELVIKELLEPLLIFFVNQTIVEDAENFVAPEFDDLLL